jgi:hypothetical protein
MRDTTIGAALAVMLAAATPTVAHAQCDAGTDGGIDPLLRGMLRDSFPADQSLDVPINSPVRLRYFGRVPSPAVLCVLLEGSDMPCVPGTASSVGTEVIWRPTRGVLEPLRRYFVTYQESADSSNRLAFTTGRSTAPTRLVFNGIAEADARNARNDTCGGNAVDITVKFDRVAPTPLGISDTPWPESDIEYVIFQTRGPGIGGPRERDRVRLQRSGSASNLAAQRTFRLRGAEIAGPVCFNVQAIDPLGRRDGNDIESCTDPATGNNFQGCAARPGASLTGAWSVTYFVLAALSLCRRRRGRRGSSHQARA